MVDLYTKDWKLEGVKAILVDKDGTFVDSNPYWGKIVSMRVQAIIEYYGIPKIEYKNLCLALGYDVYNNILVESAAIALLSRDEIIKLVLEELKKLGIKAEYNKISEIFNEVHEKFLPIMYDYIVAVDGIEDFFIKMKEAGVRLCVVTSDIQINAQKTVEHLGFGKYFDYIIGKDNCTKDKKTGEPAEVALRLLKESKENVISLGDAPMDYLMAKNARLKGCILVATGQMGINCLKEMTPSSVNSLREVLIN